jgi:pyruvate/2-oxoglutarate dehydrogenase complex dihydrolipoamide dehydrogenase (E3) component
MVFAKSSPTRHGRLLGATVVGPHAGETIHELTIAIQHGLTARDVANTLSTHSHHGARLSAWLVARLKPS